MTLQWLICDVSWALIWKYSAELQTLRLVAFSLQTWSLLPRNSFRNKSAKLKGAYNFYFGRNAISPVKGDLFWLSSVIFSSPRRFGIVLWICVFDKSLGFAQSCSQETLPTSVLWAVCSCSHLHAMMQKSRQSLSQFRQEHISVYLRKTLFV